MTKLNEAAIEQLAIEQLEAQGYHYLSGAAIQRSGKDEVLMLDVLREAIGTLNPTLPADAQDDALQQARQAPDNQAFHKLLVEGANVTLPGVESDQERGDYVRLIDFAQPDNNRYHVVNQYTIVENKREKRPDVLLFINGLPLVVIELKSPVDENATLESAYQQLQTYKAIIPTLFVYNALLIVSDGTEAQAGSLSAEFSRFMAWKASDIHPPTDSQSIELETLIAALLNPQTLLDIVQNFTVFEQSKSEDNATGISTVTTVKKVAAYHQYYAVNKALESVLQASTQQGDRKGGVIWHTQGSGKSLSMVFVTGKIIQTLNNPTVVVITDRNDLDDQLFDTFAAATELLRQEPVQAQSRHHLQDLLKVASGGVVFTTIQKFQPEIGNIYQQLSDRTNIVVIADEAHRTQYGFHAKLIDEKDETGQVIGKRTVYGFAKYVRDALPNATYLGFTGTPIEDKDINTPAVFGSYVDIYDIAQAVGDGATVKIYYESRLAKIALTTEGRALIQELDNELTEDEESSGTEDEGLLDEMVAETARAKRKWTQLEALVGSQERIKAIAQDIVTHFETRQMAAQGKGMIVSMSRRIAAALYDEIVALRPEWHSDDLDKGIIKVVMTAASSDGPAMARHHTNKSQRRKLAERMKNPDDALELVIVRDMWLTGFDAPSLHTMYIDKPMQGHNLMQAIARVNRVYKDKPGGLIVDYLGIAADLQKALSFYAESGGTGDPTLDQEQAVYLMEKKREVVAQMFHSFDYQPYFNADTRAKLAMILAAQDHILGLEDGRRRFGREVAALAQGFALAVPHRQAMAIKDEVAFFQAVKARLTKFDTSNTGSGTANRTSNDAGMETAIRQVIDSALVTTEVVDVFDAAGLKKPDISILSDEFLDEVRGMEHKNIALETLNKLLNDEITQRSKTNLVKSKSLMEMLEASIRRYHNKAITAAQVIEELINIGKDIRDADTEAVELELTEYEYAFYTAIAENDSAKEVMQKETLRKLAIVLTKRIRKDATIDWALRENAQAKLRVTVKRTLRQYGYPPDMQKLAVELVLAQAEMLAEEIVGEP